MFQETPQQAHLITAFAIVIESSLEIALEWPKPLVAYFTHIVKRVNDAHQPSRLSISFVGYGAVDTMPSPILCKRFFSDNRMIYKELFDNPLHFGIGKTNSGGGRGMAALEGLVSALEMFDGLNSLPNTKIAASYILHIATTPPDNSQRPLWNDNVMMDDMSWESLPNEFKSRNISYNLLTLKAPPRQLSDLYSAVNGDIDSSTLWFDLRPPHCLMASTIKALQPVKVVPPTKRQSEVPPTLDNKRQRLQSAAESPKLAASKPTLPLSRASQSPSPPPSQSSAQPQPQSQSQLQPPSLLRSQFMAGVTVKDAEDRIQMAENNLKLHLAAIERAQEDGDLDRVRSMQQDYTNKRLHIEKMKNIFNQYKQFAMKQEAPMPASSNMSLQQQSQLQNQSSTQSKGEGISSPFLLNAGNTGNASTITTSHQSAGSEPSQSQLNLTTNVAGVSQSPNLPLTPPVQNNMNATLNPQMQKLIEQKQLSQQHLGSHPIGTGMQNQSPVSGTTGPLPASVIDISGMNSMSGPSSMPRQQLTVPHWMGMLTWTSDGSRQEMKCIVILQNAVTAQKAHVKTWPDTMTLQPGGRFNLHELQEWAKRHQPCLCGFRSAPSEPDMTRYKALLAFLTSKQIFATAAWTTPSGNKTHNILFFPHNSQTLGAAVFPLTGLPDLPLTGMGGLQQGGQPDPSSIPLPPAMAKALANMSPAERQQVLARYFMAQSGLQQQQQQQQQPVLMNPPMSSSGTLSSFAPSMLATPLNVMGTQSPGNPMMNIASGNALGGPMPMNPMGGMPQNINSDIFQPFVQRSTGSGMNTGHNMGR